MATNTLLTVDQITREAMMLLENNLHFTATVNRQYDDQFASAGGKIGSSLRVRRPNRYTVRTGATLSVQNTVEQYETISVATQLGVDVEFSSAELTLSLDDFSDRILKPAMSQLANEVDRLGLVEAYQNTYHTVGTPGTTPDDIEDLLLIGSKLDNSGTPRDDMRHVTINPLANAKLVKGMSGFFNPGSEISNQFRKGLLASDNLGFASIGMDQNIPIHTVGPLGGTPLVDGASQTGSSLNTKGWTAAAAARLNKGDVFTIAGVYAVNPQTRTSTGELQQFVVTANVSSDGTGDAVVPISPPLTPSGAYQTVTASPADGAAITVVGSASTPYVVNLGYHEDAYTLVTADLELPAVKEAKRMKYKNISMRYVRDYDITNDLNPSRFDILLGWKTLRGETACRLLG